MRTLLTADVNQMAECQMVPPIDWAGKGVVQAVRRRVRWWAVFVRAVAIGSQDCGRVNVHHFHEGLGRVRCLEPATINHIDSVIVIRREFVPAIDSLRLRTLMSC